LFYAAALGLLKGRRWLTWLASAATAAVVIFLIVFNSVHSPLITNLRQVPYVGRLGQVLETDKGTGKVRILIWEGVIDMIGWHAPWRRPARQGSRSAQSRVTAHRLRTESMYVACNRFYPPDLAHYERRNASPDRSAQ
jgi:hypothetical protein